jgi:hypothetical protein
VKRALLCLFALAAIAAVFLFTQRTKSSVRVGKVQETTYIGTGETGWVTAINAAPVRNVNTEFKNGDRCVVNYGGTFVDHGISHGLRIMEYDGLMGQTTGGTLCPSGTLFALRGYEARLLTAAIREIGSNHEKDRKLIMESEKESGTQITGERFNFVRVVNSVNNANGHFDPGDACTLNGEDKGLRAVAVRSRDSARLVRYTGPSGYGSGCGTGTLFWTTPSPVSEHRFLDSY